MNTHERNNYIIGAGALVVAALALYGVYTPFAGRPLALAGSGGAATVNGSGLAIGGAGGGAHASPFAWPELTAEQEKLATSAFKMFGAPSPAVLQIFCDDANCAALAQTLQYDAYQGGLDTHAAKSMFDSPPGILVVGPKTAAPHAGALEAALGVKVAFQEGLAPVSLSIGARQ